MSLTQASSRSPSPQAGDGGSRLPSPVRGQQQIQDLSGSKPMKPNNGWTKEQEELMAGWSDIASCYRWMHDRCEKIMAKNNMMITVPVIILSTLTGSANFIASSLDTDNPTLAKYVQIGIGGVSIFTGILTTLGNFFRYAQTSESHRVASIAWGKFQRQLAVELALHPRERIDCMDFLKICRAELDRMIEQSPPIPDKVIYQFENEFRDIPSLKRPDIAHGMDHTKVFVEKDTRIKQIAADAAIFLQQKRKVWHHAMMPDVDRHVDQKLEKAVADLSGSTLTKLQDKILALERVVQEQADATVKSKSQYTIGGRTTYRTYLRDNADIVRPFQPPPNAHRRLSIQIRTPSTQNSATASNTTLPPTLRLPSVSPPPSTPLHRKTVDVTLPGAVKTSPQDLISALIQPQQEQQQPQQEQQTGFEPKEQVDHHDETK